MTTLNYRRSIFGATLAGLLALSGCSQLPQFNAGVDDTERPSIPPSATPTTVATVSTTDVADATEIATLAPPTDLWALIGRDISWQAAAPERVARALDAFLAQPQLVTVLSDRAEPFLQYVVAEVQARGLPMELALVPVVESMLDPWAHSSARASGLWQISPATGEHYGLKRSWWYDERLDFVKATDFALDYLTELHQTFDDWPLALAAYNAGPNRVKRVIAKAKIAQSPVDYWQLSLPKETRDYVPKIIALGALIQSPDTYGLIFPATPIVADLTSVPTGGQIELTRAAELAGIDAKDLRRLNPAHLRWATAPDGPDYLWVPATVAPTFGEKLAALPSDQRVQWQRYQIQSGDSLIRIARRFDTQVQLLREVNGIKGNLIRAGKTLMIPQGGDWRGSLQVAALGPAPKRPSRYRVKTGDSLWSIAQQFNLDMGNLVRWNALSPATYLQPGQTLRLQP